MGIWIFFVGYLFIMGLESFLALLAFWIAHRACKCVFDDLDGLQKAPHSTAFVWTAMKKFFRVNNQNEMLPHLYSNFDKSKFAMFTKELVAGCEKNDPLCESFFTHAGEYLARYVNTLAAKAHNVIIFLIYYIKISVSKKNKIYLFINNFTRM